jgi:hypothetical protein
VDGSILGMTWVDKLPLAIRRAMARNIHISELYEQHLAAVFPNAAECPNYDVDE